MNLEKIFLLTLMLGAGLYVTAQDTTSALMIKGPDVMPEFPGGEDSLYSFLSKNIKYPKTAINKEIEGIAYVEFVVCEDGKLCEVKTVRDIGGGCGDAAEQVVKDMPNWKPGTSKGKPVRVYFTLPVQFAKLSNREIRKEERRKRRESRRKK